MTDHPGPGSTTPTSTEASEPGYACRWCGQHECVPSLVAEHEARCVARVVRVA